ncbi:MAG TPA: hypothetical protein VGK73_27110 [Polyangiaceae bacterium]
MRWPLYALPVAAVIVVALALVTAGSTRPYRVARVWGGPTDAPRLGVRVEVFEIREDLGGGFEELPVTGGVALVELESGGFRGARSVKLDAEGGAEAAFELPAGRTAPLLLMVEQEGHRLAAGELPRIDAGTWARAARRRGGWASGQAGAYSLRVAPGRGALAVPFEEELWVEALRDGAPAAGVRVQASSGGAQVMPADATFDAHGRAVFRIAPREHAVTVALRVGDPAAPSELSFDLPVAPGALRASSAGDTLLVEAPVQREVAYFALVTESERLLGGRLLLAPDGRGGSSARVPLPPLPRAPTHAVVSSERDLRSPSSVGWPLPPLTGTEPATTFDAVDALLLDGRRLGALRERARRSRVRWATAAFCSLALLLEIALLTKLTRASDRKLDTHLEREGIATEEAARLAPRRSPALLLALAAVALGFFVMAVVAILRLR